MKPLEDLKSDEPPVVESFLINAALSGEVLASIELSLITLRFT
jgi:hypothetical protein